MQSIDIQNLDFLNDNVNVEQAQNPLSELEQTHSAKSKTPFSDRFIQNNETDRVEFKNQRENTNTKRKMNGCVNTFKTFLESVNGEHREIFYLPPQTLDEYLQKFSIGLRKEKTKEGESNEYQPCTLDEYQSMIPYGVKYNYHFTVQRNLTSEIIKSRFNQTWDTYLYKSNNLFSDPLN